MTTETIIDTAATEISAYLVGVRTVMLATVSGDQPAVDTLGDETKALLPLVQASDWPAVLSRGAISSNTASALGAIAVDDPVVVKRALGLRVIDLLGTKFRAAIGAPEAPTD